MFKRFLLVLLLAAFALPASARTDLVDAAGLPVYADVVTASAVVTVGNSLTTNVRGQSTATVNISAITGTTATFELSNDNLNYSAVLCTVPGTGAAVLNTTTTGFWVCPIAGASQFRVRAVGGTSFTGSLNISQGTIAAAGTRHFIVGSLGGIFDAANNATAPANVLVQGYQLQSGVTATVGTAGQVGSPVAGLDHVPYARIGGPVTWSCFVEAVTVTTQCQAAPAAGLKLYVTSVHISNEAATVQGVDVVFGTGANCATGITALTHKFQMGTVATTTSPHTVEATFMSPLNPTAANAICVRPTAATAFGATITGYTAP